MIALRQTLAIGALCAVAGCSGGGGSPSSSVQPQTVFAGGKLVLAIPAKTADSRAKHPEFLSPSAASVAISVTGIAQAVVADVSADSTACVTSGTTRTCDIAVSAPVGTDTFTATLYAGPSATGAVLGSGSATQAIAASVPFSLSVAVDGEVASITLTANRKQFTGGFAAQTTISVAALDAGGNTISGTYAAPITLTNSDTSGTFTIAPSVVTDSSTTIVLSYNGGTNASSATISASAANVPASSVSTQIVTVVGGTPTPSPSPTPKPTPKATPTATPSATPTPTPTATPTPAPPGSPYLYAAQLGVPGITVTAHNANGDAAPIRSIDGEATDLDQTYDVGVDSGGLVYASALRSATVTVYAKGANGDVAPIRTITGGDTGLSAPLGIGFDPANDLVIANFGAETVTVYAPGANGDAVPLRTISGADTGISQPYGLALDTAGKLYLVNNASQFGGTDSVTVYAAGAHGDAVPLRTIMGTNTGFSGATYDAVDAADTLYVSSTNANSVSIFKSTANGNVAPDKVIVGQLTGLNGPSGVAVDASGNVYVANQGGADIEVFAAGASGNVAPIRTIVGADTGMNVPLGLHIAP